MSEISKLENVEEISELMGIWNVSIRDCPIDLKIKVIKLQHLPKFPYQGIANYGIKAPKAGDPYWSMQPSETIQGALVDALSGFLSCYDLSQVDDTEFKLLKDW